MGAGFWSDCSLVEVVPGKQSGAPVLVGTGLPVEAITGNVDAFMGEGLSMDEAIVQTLGCYLETPGGADGIKTILDYRAAHERQLQP